MIKQNLVITGQYEDVFKVNLDIKLVKTIENIEKFRRLKLPHKRGTDQFLVQPYTFMYTIVHVQG